MPHSEQPHELRPLRQADLDADPIWQFGKWYDEAVKAGLPMPEAMTLATASAQGVPSARMVLLRGWDERGFAFFTNYESRKGRELAGNAHAALVFFWPQLDRQIRIEGTVEKTTTEESDAYFRSRPHGSQLGAWASQQSEVIPNRSVLEKRIEELAAQYSGDVPRPPHWGGWRVIPSSIEFWQGQPSRLHDRIRYRRLESGVWQKERLSP